MAESKDKSKDVTAVQAEDVQVVEADVPDAPPSKFDVYGGDDRRIVSGWAETAAKELAQRITAETGEKIRIVPQGSKAAEKIEAERTDEDE